jgi:hypothetical protein
MLKKFIVLGLALILGCSPCGGGNTPEPVAPKKEKDRDPSKPARP